MILIFIFIKYISIFINILKLMSFIGQITTTNKNQNNIRSSNQSILNHGNNNRAPSNSDVSP